MQEPSKAQLAHPFPTFLLLDVSDNGDRKDIGKLLHISGKLVTDIGRLVAVTASWCVRCDLRDKLKGKRACK